MPRRPHRPLRRFSWLGKVLIVAAALQGVAVCRAQDPYADEKTQRWAPYPAGRSTIVTSPAVGPDNTIYIAATVETTPASGRVLAVRPNRTEKWKQPFDFDGEVADVSPVLSGDGTTLYIASLAGVLRAVDTETGKERWNFDRHLTHSIWASAAVAADGTVYVGTTDDGNPSDSLFWALSPVDGSELWRVSSSGAINVAPAIAADGTVYFAGGKELYAVSHSGQVKWRFPLSAEIWAPPAIGGDGTIYVGSNVEEFVAITPEGKDKWGGPLPIRAGGGAAIGPDETIYVGTIEAGGSGKLYALTPDGGTRPNWPISLPGSVLTVPAIRADGTIIFGCDHTLRAVNPDGSARWTATVADVVTASPVIDTDGSIYVGAGGNLYAFRGSGSPLSEYASWPMYNRDIRHQSQAAEPANGGVLVNLATRGQTGPTNPLIAGFILSGSGPETLLVRGVGPSLGHYEISHPLPNPVLTLRTEAVAFGGNDDWEVDANTDPETKRAVSARVGAFPLDAGSKDAAVLAALPPTIRNTAIVESVDQNSGVALVELYDTDLRPGSPRLINVSTRGYVGTGANALFGGFVIEGEGNMRVLIRGVGPGLAQFGVNGLLQRPTIAVFDLTRTQIATNTGWTSRNRKGDLAGAASLAGAFQLQDTSTDSALILSLGPGLYTVQLSGADGDTGIGLVEVYALPH